MENFFGRKYFLLHFGSQYYTCLVFQLQTWSNFRKESKILTKDLKFHMPFYSIYKNKGSKKQTLSLVFRLLSARFMTLKLDAKKSGFQMFQNFWSPLYMLLNGLCHNIHLLDDKVHFSIFFKNYSNNSNSKIVWHFLRFIVQLPKLQKLNTTLNL